MLIDTLTEYQLEAIEQFFQEYKDTDTLQSGSCATVFGVNPEKRAYCNEAYLLEGGGEEVRKIELYGITISFESASRTSSEDVIYATISANGYEITLEHHVGGDSNYHRLCIEKETETTTNEINDDIESIVEDFDSELDSSDERVSEEESDDESAEDNLFKDELASQFDVRFVKAPGRDSQHLVSAETGEILCSQRLEETHKKSDVPGPYEPICGACREILQDESVFMPANWTVAEARKWLADEIEDIDEPRGPGYSKKLRKPDLVAIMSHIQSLKEESR